MFKREIAAFETKFEATNDVFTGAKHEVPVASKQRSWGEAGR
jgi:hypothetical protein